jgi:ATP-dependent Clp protease ATP-binding subunit ClpA
MYERFTDRARKAMQLANQEAQRLGHDHIDAEHILIGIAKEGSGVAAQVLKNLGVECNSVLSAVRDCLRGGPDVFLPGKLPQTDRARAAVVGAIEDAKGLGHNYVGTEHLLLAMLRAAGGIAGEVLAGFGLTVEKVRDEIGKLLNPQKQAADAAPGGWGEAEFKLFRNNVVVCSGILTPDSFDLIQLASVEARRTALVEAVALLDGMAAAAESVALKAGYMLAAKRVMALADKGKGGGDGEKPV